MNTDDVRQVSGAIEARLEKIFDELASNGPRDGCPYLLPSWTSKEEVEGIQWLARTVEKIVKATPKHKNYDKAAMAAMYLGKVAMHGTATHEAFHFIEDLLLEMLELQRKKIEKLETRNATLQAIVDAS